MSCFFAIKHLWRNCHGLHLHIALLWLSMHFFSQNIQCNEKKVLICGICRNVALAAKNTIKNIETLGAHFDDYAVIIYENNSTDLTAAIYAAWAEKNHHVDFRSETLLLDELPISRTEKIARARNIVLSMAREPQYNDFDYLVMVDLDLKFAWPFREIVKTIESKIEWDCVSANGRLPDGTYFDRYAFRSTALPLGPELMGNDFWPLVHKTGFAITGDAWIPALSAFGGLAIYKKRTLLQFAYSGIVTRALQMYYEKIFRIISPKNQSLSRYLRINGIKNIESMSNIPIVFRNNGLGHDYLPHYEPITCCEHVALHASMAMAGFDKFYINPKMVMNY